MSSRPLGLSAFVTLVAFVGGSFGLLQNSSAAEPVTAALSSSGLQSGIATADVNLESSGATVVHPTEVIPIITKSEFNSIITTQFLSGIGQIDAGKRSWGPEQVIGEPDTEGAGDIITAWASLSPDDQDEWLILQYERTINAKIVEIHETYNPGAVVKVTAFNADGEEVVAWEGDDPTPTTEDRGISIIPIDIDFETDRIKVYIASTVVPGWNEIDAVGLHDKNGDVLWAVNVECSSTYADPFSPVTVTSYANYGPEQAAGEPNTLVAGDAPTAWASATADGQEEWLLCHYDELIIPESVAVHETSAPGALSKVSVFNDGEEVVVWEGEDPTPADEPQGISVIPIDIDFEIDTVKLYFDSVNVPGWNEIDAVGLRSTAGETQWASTVEASSTYDSNIAFVDTLPLAPYVDPNVMALQNEVEALRSEVESLRSDLEEIKQLLRNRLNDEDPIEEN